MPQTLAGDSVYWLHSRLEPHAHSAVVGLQEFLIPLFQLHVLLKFLLGLWASSER